MPASEGFKFQNVSVRFGGLNALKDVSITVDDDGGIHGIIGPNGAGKTTLFNVVTGVMRPATGAIMYRGHDLVRTPRSRLASLGISRTFQNLALFNGMTVLENVMMGAYSAVRVSPVASMLSTPRARRGETLIQERALTALDEIDLISVANEEVGNLPYGVLKSVELARALSASPKLLLLDEPAAGLNDTEVVELTETLRKLRARRGMTLIVVEHHMGLMMNLCQRITVLDLGSVIAEGTPAEVATDPLVMTAYLGGEV